MAFSSHHHQTKVVMTSETLKKRVKKKSIIKKGDKIKITSDVKYVLIDLGFAEGTSMAIGQKYADTEQVANNVWYDDEQGYVTVDLCVEIPIDCCEKVKRTVKAE